MNTTREQRAEAYARSIIDDDSTFGYRCTKRDYLAGATEEAAIKDAVILELAEALRLIEMKREGFEEDLVDCPKIASEILEDHSALLEELAKGKV